ncbi:Dihydrofolate synthase/folylpolyglutamate synthase [compost metagenome]
MCDALGNPQHQFKSIHIAGTNGKGSTSHMLAAILQQAGYKTGLYTSPHLRDFRERIRINGKMVPKSFVSQFVSSQQKLIQEIEPSFFEVTVAMAFEYFAKQQVDIAVIEVGLGGRLDSTNIITPELSVITNISLDHTQILGHTIAQIAFEKAGIIKTNIPVVIGEKQAETTPVFEEKTKAMNAPIYFAESTLQVQGIKRTNTKLVLDIYKDNTRILPKLTLDLTGTYQLKNIVTVIQAVLILREKGYSISDKAIYQALRKVKKLTGLQGRWQTLSKNPLVICDTGHNIAGISEVLLNIKATAHQSLHIVMGMVNDKDISGVLKLLPEEATYYFCKPDMERGLSADELAAKAKQYGLIGQTFESIAKAFDAAKKNYKAGDLIFIGGSTFVVAEVL